MDARRIAAKVVGQTIVSMETTSAGWVGHVIKFADGNKIKIAVADGQWCCESFGTYLFVNGKSVPIDQFEEFVGAQIVNLDLDAAISDVCPPDDLKEVQYISNNYGESNLKNVTFTTDRGAFTIVLYNEHNGYYSHEFVIQSKKHSVKGQL